MASHWSRGEIEAIVEDYFSMLEEELSGRRYNKAEHRRNLAPLLSNRTSGAIERKPQNISAVLIELGFPYIPGYKPLRNYQLLLRDVVASHLDSSPDLIKYVKDQVQEPAAIPVVDDILAISWRHQR